MSAWLKTVGLGVGFEPTFFARFGGGSEQVVARTTSEGQYTYVSREFTAPPSAERLTIGLHLKKEQSAPPTSTTSSSSPSLIEQCR